MRDPAGHAHRRRTVHPAVVFGLTPAATCRQPDQPSSGAAIHDRLSPLPWAPFHIPQPGDELAAAMGPIWPSSGATLDLGCGTSSVLENLSLAGVDVALGVDGSAVAVETVQQRHGADPRIHVRLIRAWGSPPRGSQRPARPPAAAHTPSHPPAAPWPPSHRRALPALPLPRSRVRTRVVSFSLPMSVAC